MTGSANGHPEDRLSEYLDDELTIEDRAAIDRHLASCEDCRSELDALRLLARAIAEESIPPLPAGLGERIGRRLDEATVLRPRRWRVALPATIAATISAIGILIAVQWREGRLPPTSPKEVAQQAADAVPPEAPPPPAARSTGGGTPAEKAKAAPNEQGARERDFKTEVRQEPPPRAIDSVVGGAPANEPAPAAPAVPARPMAADDERHDALSKQTVTAMTGNLASKDAANAVAVSTCADRWSDSGARGTWEVDDPVATASQLNTIAHDVGGIGLWRGPDDGRPYLLIVPRSRYAEVFYALRARGIAGLVEPPALAIGDDCTALSITIVRAR